MLQRARPFLGKIGAFSIICAMLDVVFHAILAPTYAYDPPSYFVQSGLFKPAAGISLFVIFFLLGVVFLYIQQNLPGSRVSKGLRFGGSFGGLWLLGVVGMSVFFGSPLLHEVLGGACDCAALMILGLLLGYFSATDSDWKSGGCPFCMLPGVSIIAFFFIVGQYAAFLFMSTTPYFSLFGLTTFLWTVSLGMWAAVVYWLLRDGIDTDYAPMQRSLYLGGVVIGIDWMLFNLFVLLFVAMPVFDPIILAGLNIVSIILGIFAYENLLCKIYVKNY